MRAGMLSVLAALALVVSVSASLMAVDLGGEFLKVAVVKAGRTPISIAINEMSRRKTPALVGFLDGERVLGEAAVTMSGRHPDKVFGYLRDLLGKPAKHPDVQKFVQENKIIYDILEDPVRKTVRIKVPDTGTEYAIEELVASVLTYAHQISADYSGVDIRDTVLLVPAYFGHAQRQALLDAADLAGLNVLSLMHSHAAAALQYGIERSFTNRTENVVIYDVGGSGVTAALVQFSEYSVKEGSKTVQQSQFEVKDVAWSEGAGAQHLDLLLMRHFAAEFVAKYKTADVLAIPKAVAKMSKPTRRTKEMLSANVNAPFMVEELYDGKDFSSSISRADFEELAGDFWSAMKAPLQELVSRNNLTADSFTVQLVGGGSRVPRVQTELASVAEGLKLEKQLDADEAAVLGGGLYAANKSTMFRLRKFGMKDGHVFPVSVAIDDLEGVPEHHHKFAAANGGETLIPYMKALDTKRRVSLTEMTADPLKVTLSLTGDRLPCCMTSNKLVSYTITGLTGVLERYNQTGKVQLHFVGDSNGLVGLQKADATVEFIEHVEVEKEVPDDDSENQKDDSEDGDAPATPEDGAENADAGADDGEDIADDGKPKGGSKEEEALKSKKGSKDKDAKENNDAQKEKGKDSQKEKGSKDDGKADEKDAKPKPKMKKIKVMKRVKRTRVVALTTAETVRHGVQPMSNKDKTASKLRLKDLRTKELAKQESARAKNELESYIISMHGKLADNEDIITVSTEAQRGEFSKQLTAMEDWLYMDPAADEAVAKVYQDKLAELLKLGTPIEGRVYEMQRREERLKGAQRLIEIIGMSTNSWPETRPWLNTSHVQSLQSQADELSSWLKEKTAAQEKRQLHEEPAYTVEEVSFRVDTLHNNFKRLQNVKAPKPPPPPPSPPSPPANETTEAASGSESPSAEQAGGEDAAAKSDDSLKDELRRRR